MVGVASAGESRGGDGGAAPGRSNSPCVLVLAAELDVAGAVPLALTILYFPSTCSTELSHLQADRRR